MVMQCLEVYIHNLWARIPGNKYVILYKASCRCSNQPINKSVAVATGTGVRLKPWLYFM